MPLWRLVVSAPSMMKRFSPALAPSIEMPPSFAVSRLAPGAWVTSEVKSRPLGIFSMSSSRSEVARALCLTSMSGDSATTWTVSVIAAGAERQVDAEQLAEAQVDVLDLRRGEAGQVRGDFVAARGERREAVRPGGVGHGLDRGSRHALRDHGGADDGAALRVLDHAIDRSTLLLRRDGQRNEERRGHECREGSKAHPILLGDIENTPVPRRQAGGDGEFAGLDPFLEQGSCQAFWRNKC